MVLSGGGALALVGGCGTSAFNPVAGFSGGLIMKMTIRTSSTSIIGVTFISAFVPAIMLIASP
jgi:hypothetical protein